MSNPPVYQVSPLKNEASLTWKLGEHYCELNCKNGSSEKDYPRTNFTIKLGTKVLDIPNDRSMTRDGFEAAFKKELEKNGINTEGDAKESVNHFIKVFCDNMHQGFYGAPVADLFPSVFAINKQLSPLGEGETTLTEKDDFEVVIQTNRGALTGYIQLKAKVAKVLVVIGLDDDAERPQEEYETVHFTLEASGQIPLDPKSTHPGFLTWAKCQMIASKSFVREVKLAMGERASMSTLEGYIKKTVLLALGVTLGAGGATVGAYFALMLAFGVSGLALTAGTTGIGAGVLLGLLAITAIAMFVQNRTQRSQYVTTAQPIAAQPGNKEDNHADQLTDKAMSSSTLQLSSDSGSSSAPSQSSDSDESGDNQAQKNLSRRGSVTSISSIHSRKSAP